MSYPQEVIDEFLQKCANTGQANEQADKYILKISGKEEYLLGNYPLCQYQVRKGLFTHNQVYLNGPFWFTIV